MKVILRMATGQIAVDHYLKLSDKMKEADADPSCVMHRHPGLSVFRFNYKDYPSDIVTVSLEFPTGRQLRYGEHAKATELYADHEALLEITYGGDRPGAKIMVGLFAENLLPISTVVYIKDSDDPEDIPWNQTLDEYINNPDACPKWVLSRVVKDIQTHGCIETIEGLWAYARLNEGNRARMDEYLKHTAAANAAFETLDSTEALLAEPVLPHEDSIGQALLKRIRTPPVVDTKFRLAGIWGEVGNFNLEGATDERPATPL